MFHKAVAHGMWGGALIPAVLGTELSGRERSMPVSRCTFFTRSVLGIQSL